MFGLIRGENGVRRLRKAAETGGAYGGRGGLRARAETDAATNMNGFAAGTLVATNLGWRPVEAVTTGDSVMTFDNGLQPVVAVTRNPVAFSPETCPEDLRPISVPAGALDNERPMIVLAEQTVMIESDTAEALYGDPFTLIPAVALIGHEGIERMNDFPALEVVTLHFENDEVVFVDGNALVLCRAAVPGVMDLSLLERRAPAPYRVLNRDQAEVLVECMAWEAVGEPLPPLDAGEHPDLRFAPFLA